MGYMSSYIHYTLIIIQRLPPPPPKKDYHKAYPNSQVFSLKTQSQVVLIAIVEFYEKPLNSLLLAWIGYIDVLECQPFLNCWPQQTQIFSF